LTTIHGSKIPNSNKTFRLNWASGGGICDKKEDRLPEYSLFVGDLSHDIDETFLLSIFRNKYPSCHSAKIMTDPLSGISRGYGFVRFLNQIEQQEAVIEMNGVILYNNDRPLRVSFATPKNSNSYNNNTANYTTTRYLQLSLQAPALIQQPTDPNNTTVFIGGLSSPVTEEELYRYFNSFGEIQYVKIPQGKGCGFIQYISRSSAEQAIERMNGFVIGSSRIRLSWGRSTTTTTTTTTTTNNSSNGGIMSPISTHHFEHQHNLGSFKPLSPPSSITTRKLSLFGQDDWLSHHYGNNNDDQDDRDDWIYA
jgi:RNA recognition motif-containing protein